MAELNPANTPDDPVPGTWMLDCAVVPVLVLPLAVLFATTPYLLLVGAAYLAATAVLDEWFPRAGSSPRRRAHASAWGDLWLVLYGIDLIAFLAVALTLAGQPPSPAALPFFGLLITAGLIMGVGYNVGHDLLHRPSGSWRASYGFLLLVLLLDSQLFVSHTYGHHANVGTALDPATARRGESLYRYFLRSVGGQYREAWAFEVRRLKRRGRSPLSLRNRVFAGALGSAAVLAAVGVGVGGWALALYLGAALIGKLLFETAQYIQHYGLARLPGRRVEARHSWDCSGAASRLFMLNQNNHADHHANATVRCWELRLEPGAARMPHGYISMMLLATVPFLWFRTIDPLVDRWSETGPGTGAPDGAAVPDPAGAV